MLLTVPVSVADHGLIPNLIKAISLFPPGDNHDLLIIGTERNQESMGELEKGIGSWFRQSRVHVTSTNPACLGWPREGNYVFQQAAHFIIQNYPAQNGFLWFELDCTPLSKNWLSTLSDEYYRDAEVATRAGTVARRYMGVKQRTYETLAGELVSVEESGYHMAPCGIYPNDLAASVKTLMAITAIGRPFVEHIQWYVTQNLNETNLIQNNWRTGNYRKEGGDIVCDSKVDYGFGTKFNNPITDAVLVHGCKDGSLLELVGNGVTASKSPERVVEKLPEHAFTPDTQPAGAWGPVGNNRSLSRFTNSTQTVPEYKPDVPVSLNNNFERPINSFAVNNQHSNEPVEAPKVVTRESLGLPKYDRPARLMAESAAPLDATLVEKPKRRGRGPAKKKQKRNISPEDRERRSAQMKEVAKIAHEKRRLEKLAQETA